MTQGLLVFDDGTHTEIELSRSDLDRSRVYCFVDDHARVIYIWLGREATVRLRFVGASVAAIARKDVGLHYRVRSIDEGEEPQEFLDLFEKKTQRPVAPQTSSARQPTAS